MRGELALGGDVALPDAGALDDPFVRGVDPRRQFGIGQDLLRQIGAAAEHDRTYCSHETASCEVCAWVSAAAVAIEHLFDLVRQVVAGHLIANIDRIRKALAVGAAMALDDDAVEAEHHAAVGFRGVQLVAQRLEGVFGKQIADLRAPAARHGVAQEFGNLPRRALGRLQCDVAAKALGDDDVGGALADAVALDEADIIQLRQVHRAQQLGCLANLLAALDFLDPDIEQSDGRPFQIEQHARHRAAHHRQRHQMMRIAADGGAEVEHHRIAARRGPYRRQRRPVDAGQHAQAEPRHRRQRTGIAGRYRDIGLALLDRFDGEPHRRVLAATPQGLARLVVHADGDIGMNDAGDGLQRRVLFKLRVDQRAIAEQQVFAVGMPAQ